MISRIVTATELKAKCLALLDEVDESGDTITITKRGRPVATLQPVKKKAWKSPAGAWIGKVDRMRTIMDLDRVAAAEASGRAARFFQTKDWMDDVPVFGGPT